jgi:hypothetical protein
MAEKRTTLKSLRIPTELLKGLAQLRQEHPGRWASEHGMLLDLLLRGYSSVRYRASRKNKEDDDGQG